VIAELARAIAEGAQVRAFHAWSLLDNFQWAEVIPSGMG
jgi:beta-glucosidase